MEQPTPGAIAILEAELAETLKAVCDCFTVTRSVELARDEYGHRRARELENAVSLLKASAELGLTIAKIKGEYNHNINVLHGEIWPPPRNKVNKPETFEQGRPPREAVAQAAAESRGTPSPKSRGSNGQANRQTPWRPARQYQPAETRPLRARHTSPPPSRARTPGSRALCHRPGAGLDAMRDD